MNKIMKEAILSSLDNYNPILSQLKNKTFFITGATGLIGKYLCFTLAELNKKHELGLQILANVRNKQKAEMIFKSYLTENLIQLIVNDITHAFNFENDIDYIIHGASMTSSKDFVDRPVDTIDVALTGTRNILELAASKNVLGMTYLSSLEVYGISTDSGLRIKESDFGYLDPMNVRSSYSEGKRMAETLCVAYAHQYNLPITVARLCQTFGPGIEYSDNRVFAQFAKSVIERRDIVLKTEGKTERNYCYITDAVLGILYVLLNGESKQAYNIANENTSISIKDMAELVINLEPSNSKLVFDIVESPEALGYNPTVKINLDTEKIQALGWKAQIDLPEMFNRLIESLKEDMSR
ncbi:NAD-dependent epimerase/dehydratase family protein [Tuanshanicoccus lijuaniae]|uniref:NAD-dependent epimerase/dehydratase family protein n=1 Tax=Aerococcaceae bacterium zg-1292 TaxID=2774330 RepID=UPI0040631C81